MEKKQFKPPVKTTTRAERERRVLAMARYNVDYVGNSNVFTKSTRSAS